MINAILQGAVRLRWLVLFLTAVVAIIGGWQLNLLPIDVTPDITNKQVQINTGNIHKNSGTPEQQEKRGSFTRAIYMIARIHVINQQHELSHLKTDLERYFC